MYNKCCITVVTVSTPSQDPFPTIKYINKQINKTFLSQAR